MKTYSVIIIGAGRRGSTYANEMFKLGEKFKVVGVADPIKERRDLVQKKFGFAAEKSRHNKTVESIDNFFNEYGIKND